MLPRTTSTGSEDGADGVYALRTGLEERLDNATSVVGSASRDPNANAVARRGEGNEDDPAIGRVTDTVPARSEFLDFKLDPLFGVGCRRRPSRLAMTRVPISTGYRLTPSTQSRRGGWPANPVDSLAATRPVRSRLVVEQDRNGVVPTPEQHHDTIEHSLLLRHLESAGRAASRASASRHVRARAGLPTAAPGAKTHERTRSRPATARAAVGQRGMRPDALDLALTQRAIAHEGP